MQCLRRFLLIQKERFVGPTAGNFWRRDLRVSGRACFQAFRAFSSSNELYKFGGIVEPIFEFRAQRLSGDLCRDGDVRSSWVGTDKLNFVDADISFIVRECAPDLGSELLRPRSVGCGKGSDQCFKFFGRHFAQKLNTAQSGRGQKLGEGTPRAPAFNGHPIQQQPVVGHAKHDPTFALRDRIPQLLPRCLKLGLRSLMVESIELRILHQNVQAVDKWPGRRLPGCFACARARNKKLPRLTAQVSVSRKESLRMLPRSWDGWRSGVRHSPQVIELNKHTPRWAALWKGNGRASESVVPCRGCPISRPGCQRAK